jgi:polyribonucleotide nucleotidyltransferase
VLSDILGDEDHLGDMDFKVAGTADGITSLQMDIKIAGITEEIMKVALGQAKDGRATSSARWPRRWTPAPELGEYAPRIETIKIPTDKIREVIGTGGKVIREIVEKTGAKIDIEDDGTIKIASAESRRSIRPRIKWIKSIASEPEVGQIYTGKVVKIVDFGAFVNFFGAKDGLVHVSQIANERVEKVSDVVKEGQEVKVKLLGLRRPRQDPPVDEGRRPGDRREDRGPRGDRGDRGDRGGRDRGPRRDGDRGGRDRGPRGDSRGREGGDRDRGPRGEGDRGPRDDRGPRGEGDHDRGPRRDRDDRPRRDGGDDGPAPDFAPAFLTRDDD